MNQGPQALLVVFRRPNKRPGDVVPNELAGVDAGCPALVAFERVWSGTTQRGR
jgi:hypothetical protein